MIDHLLGRPSVKSRRLQVLAVLAFWSVYLAKGHKHGPPVLRFMSRLLSKRLTAWQIIVTTMLYLYAARNFSTLVGLACPDPLSNMYDAAYFRATWVLTALDAGFWTAMKIRNQKLRDLASVIFSLFYLIAAEQADEKVRKVRGNITVEHMRVSWNKGSQSPYLRFAQSLMRPRFMKWPPREMRIARPPASDYREPVTAWLYFNGPLSKLKDHNRIILDIPGGGFVAMNPRCNDDKLLAWATKTGLPVLSLDYKKAPEYPYPYALNECYDVYTMIVQTRGKCVGLSGNEVPKIVLTGDSAGGTLAASTTLMIIESGSSPVRRFQGQTDLPVPDGLILFYPALDMNIGSWMSEEQMALIKDRRMRGTNKRIIQRKRSQYDSLVGTPHASDDEDDVVPSSKSRSSPERGDSRAEAEAGPAKHVREPAPEYANLGPTTWSKVHQGPPAPSSRDAASKSGSRNTTTAATAPGASHRPEPMRTRLAMSSMISYFNDRVLTPEMMRAMIILYVGPHNRPDFSQDYLLSPILAPDVLLSRFPKTYFVTGERDPLVDDTIIFSGRLRRVKAAQLASGGTRLEYRDSDAQTEGFDEKAVAEVALIPGISHGFVQFPSLYPPAWKLIDRAAVWAEELFAGAERREREKRDLARRNLLSGRRNGQGGSPAVNGEDGGNGDEDLPLEMMSIAKAKAKDAKKAAAAADTEKKGSTGEEDTTGARNGEGTGKHNQGTTDASDDEDDHGADAGPYEAPRLQTRKRNAAAGKRARTRDEDDKSLVKLASTDDLLGRRMHGLAGGLTATHDDPE